MTQSSRRDANLVALGILMVAYGTNVSTPFLATYRDRLDLGASATQSIFVVYVVGILAMLFVAGQTSDRFGRRAVLVPALVLTAAGSALLIVGRDSFGFIMAGRILLGMASGAALGVGAAWIQELLGPGKELRAAFITTIVTYAGFGLGPPISTAWDRWVPNALVWPFIIHIVASLAVIPLVLSCRETVDIEGARAALRSVGERWRPRLQFGVPDDARREFWWVLAPLSVLVFAFPSTGFSLFPLLVAESYDGSDVLLTGIAGIATPWAGLVARPYLARVSARSGIVHGAVVGTCGYLLGTLAWAAGWWPLVWPAAAALGAASGIISTSALTQVAGMTDAEHRGALSSTFYLLAYSGMAMPLVITGLAAGIGMGLTLTIVCSLAAAVTLTTPLRRHVASQPA
ncbi:MAG: MFS transporter [Actinomycetota bacterium]